MKFLHNFSQIFTVPLFHKITSTVKLKLLRVGTILLSVDYLLYSFSWKALNLHICRLSNKKAFILPFSIETVWILKTKMKKRGQTTGVNLIGAIHVLFVQFNFKSTHIVSGRKKIRVWTWNCRSSQKIACVNSAKCLGVNDVRCSYFYHLMMWACSEYFIPKIRLSRSFLIIAVSRI